MHMAAQGPHGYPELFRQLLAADLTIIVPEGRRRSVILWKFEDEEVIPVFTSTARAREAIAAIDRAGRPLCLAQIAGGPLFKLLQGCGKAVIINPACNGAEMRLDPPVISRLANRSILRPCDEAEKATGDAVVVDPADYPIEVMEPVFHFLRARPDVHAAWLLRMKPAHAGDAGLYVFAVLSRDAGGRLEGDLMIVLDNAGSGKIPCGMTLLDPRNPSHAALINEATPFYAAPWYRPRAAAPESSRTNRMTRLLRRRH